MKMIKLRFAGFLLFVLAASSLFLTCDVGLGNSVDTKPPTVSITSPVTDSDIAGTFTATGAAADETSLKAVSVSFVETTDSTSYGPFTATINATTNTWSVSLNNKKADGTYEIKDGTYKITVTAKDASGRTSVATTVYQLDNTPPTVLVTSPLTYGDDSRVSFYKAIDIKGEAYDASTLSRIDIVLRAKDGTTLATGTADGTNTWTCRFDYSSGAPAGIDDNTVYYYNVTAKDAAGNTNTYFFHRSDIYPLLTASSDGTVVFPAMSTIGKLDQLGTASESDLHGLTLTKLASIRHGTAATLSQAYPDFLYLNTAAAKVQWLNLADNTSVLGTGVPIVGSILPPSDGSSITQSSIKFVLSNSKTGTSYTYTKSSSNVTLTAVGSSLNFEVYPVDSSATALKTGSYVISISFKTSASGTGSDQQAFGISAGVPILTETGVGGSASPTYYMKNINAATAMSGEAESSDSSAAADLSYSYYKDSDTSNPTTGTVAVDSSTHAYSFNVPVSQEGTFSYTLIANSGGLTTKLTRIFVVDTTAPTLVFSYPTSGLSADSTKSGSEYVVAISGTSDDGSGSGIAKVYYKSDVDDTTTDYSSASASTYTTWTQASGTINWSGSVKVSTEGNKKLWVCAVDNAGNAIISSVSFNLDLTYPLADFSSSDSFSKVSGVNATNASFTLGGLANDDALDTTDSTVVAAASAVLSWTKDGSESGSKTLSPTAAGTWSWTSPSTMVDGTADGLYVFTLTVTDIASKKTVETETVRVDHTSPTLSVTAPLANSIASTTSYTAEGTVYDLGVGLASSNAVTYVLDGEADEQTGTATVSGSQWTIPLSLTKQGVHQFTVQAKDALGNITSSGTNAFYYDTEPPTISETSIGTAETVYKAAGFSLSGTVGDTDALKSFVITESKDSGTVTTLYSASALSGTSFSYNVTTSASATDGKYDYTLTVTDVAGRTSSLTRTVKIDTTPPVVNSTVNVSGSSSTNAGTTYYSGTVTFSGTSTDGTGQGASGISKVQYSTDATNWSDAVGTTDWSLTQDLSAQAEGSYTLYFRAVDKSGLVSTASVPVTIQLDHNAPRVTETAYTSSLIKSKTDVAFAGVADDSAFTSGSLFRAASSATLKYSKDGATAVTVATGTGSGLFDWKAAGTWSWILPASWGDGLYVMTLTVIDVAGKESTVTRSVKIDATAPTVTVTSPGSGASVDGSSISISGTADDGSGVGFDGDTDAEYKIDSGSWTSLNSLVSTINWGASGISLGSEGSKTLSVRATDSLGNVSAVKTVSFFYDVAAPVITETTVGTTDTKYVKGSSTVTFGGLWTESDSLSSIVVSYRKDGGSSVTASTLTPAISGAGVAWTSSDIVLTAEGVYVFTIAATDIANKTTTLTRTIDVDVTAPVVTLSTNLGTWQRSTSVSISGTASDTAGTVNSGISKVQYAVNGGSWTDLNGTTSWSGNVTIPEGVSNTLGLRSVDVAGNVSNESTTTVKVDSQAPTFAENSANTTTLTNAALTYSGVISDNVVLAAAPLAVTIKKPDSSVSTSQLTPSSGTWTYTTQSFDASGHTDDGLWTLTFVATDLSGLATTITKSFTVDTTAPAVAITAPSTGQTGLSALSGASYNFIGTSSDSGAGVASIHYLIDHTASASALAGDYSSMSASSGTWNFSDDFDTDGTGSDTGRAEGSWYLHVYAVDSLGNSGIASAKTVQFDIDQANPVLTESSSETQYANASSSLSFGGTAMDTNALASLMVNGTSVTVNATTHAWTYSFDTTQSEGTYTLVFTATDAVGKTASVTRTVYLDKTAPSLAIATDLSSWQRSTSVAVSGTASDSSGSVHSGINKVQYSLDGSTYSDLAGTTDWSGTVIIPTGASNTLYLRAIDKAGNTYNASPLTVKVDAVAPTFIENPVNSTSTTKDPLSFAGTVSDNLGLAGVVLTRKQNGVAVTTNNTVTVSGSNWSYTQTADSAHADDGVWELTFVATDVSGLTTTITKAFTIDTTAPTLAVSIPGKNEYVSSNTVTISGTARDTGGVGFDGTADVEYSLDGSSWTAMTLSGINWTAANVDFGSTEGSKVLYVRSTDAVGNQDSMNVNFYYDKAAPALTETTVNTSDTRYYNGNISFAGTWAETNQLNTIAISYTMDSDSTSTTVNSTYYGTNTIGTNTSSWSYVVDVSSLTDGTYYFTIKATDAANRTTSLSRTIVLDRVNPTVALTTDLSGWHQSQSISLAGTAADTAGSVVNSGVAKVQYSLNYTNNNDSADDTWIDLTGSTSWSGTITVPDGSANSLYLRSLDQAGNASAIIGPFTVQVDSIAPDFDITLPATTPIVNGTTDLTFTIEATDTTSGPSSVTASLSATSWSTIATATGFTSGSATITVPAASLPTAEGNKKIYFKVKDVAGNETVAVGSAITVDKTAPTGSVTSHASGATVNKNITIAGSASDSNLSTSSGSFWVWKPTNPGASDAATAGAWEASSSGTVTGTTSWSVSNFNTKLYASSSYDESSSAGFQLLVGYLASDLAGNTKYITCVLTVDQDSDKPIIKLTNLATTGTPTLKQTTSIYGTISDDDGSVTSLSMKNSASDGWTNVTLDGQSFTYTVTGSDGDKALYFQITDAAGTVFTTALTASDTTPRLYQSVSTYLETPLSFKLDTTPPEIGSDSVGIKLSGASVFSAYSSSSAYYGGSASGVFNVQFMSSDANGVASATVSVTDSASTVKSSSAALGSSQAVTVSASADTFTTASAHGFAAGDRVYFSGTTLPGGVSANVPYYVISSGLTTTAFEISATSGGSAIDISSAGETVSVTTGWSTASSISVTSLASGAATLTITVTDNSGLSSTMSKTILVDNATPSISVTSHTMNEQVTGDVVFTGTSDDGTGSGVASVKYHVGKCADLNSASWTTLSSQLSWSINFTSAASNVITTTATYANSTYATETSSGSNVWILPIYLRSTDMAGNVCDYTFYLDVDPDGDKPTVSVSYPSSGTTLGGNIRVFGSATDNVSVSSVWMEIDTNNDGLYDSTDIAALVTSGYGTTSGLANGFQVDGTASWSKTINSSGEFNASGTTVAATTITSGVRYEIVTVDGTDYTALGASSNTAGLEFTATANGSSSAGSGTVTALTNLIQFRVRACDNNSTYGTWSDFRTIKIDNKAPKIGSTTPLKVVQYTDATLTTIASEQSYVADMYLRGEWYLVGSVEDESGIKSISVSGSATGTLSSQSSWFVQGTAVGSYYNYTLRIPVGKTLTDTSCGAQSYTIYVEDASDPTGTTTQTVTLNYDNKSPTVATPTHGGSVISTSNTVVQSNNTYTFSSTVTEDGSSDSGFNRLVFFFVRRSASGSSLDRVYDPMIAINASQSSSDVTGNRTYLSNLTWDSGDVPRLSITGATRSGEDTLTHSSIVGNYNVRVGGLVRIAGVDRLIKTVDHTAGTITFSPSASTSYTSASLIYGLVVDNTVVETGVWSGSTLSSITNDDGDGMVESVVKSGGTWTWDASINSKYIPDGPISLYYVAYDKAGNSKSGYVLSAVANSGPRISKVWLGTDLSGDGTFDTSEVSTVYTATSGSEPATVNLADQTFKMKGDLAVIPEFVGGNGTLKYVWTPNASGTTAWDGSTYRTTQATSSEGTLTSCPGVTVSGTAYADGITLSSADASVIAMSGALKLFSFTVWDSTEETTQGTDSQWALVNVPVNVSVVDTVAPYVVIDPFSWTSLSSNSIYGSSSSTTSVLSLNGHIELPADLPSATFLSSNTSGEYDRDPKVSGKITITGSAYDDQRLDSLWVTFDGFTPTSGTYLATRTDVGDSRTYYEMAQYNSSTGAWTYAATVPSMATNSYTFAVTPDYLSQSGHRVTWTLSIDTSNITGYAAADARVRVVARDHASLLSSYTTHAQDSSVSSYNVPYYQMDVVPYIARVQTNLYKLNKNNWSVYNRTALGHYPVATSETLTAYGFNLSSTTDTTYGSYTTASIAASGLSSGVYSTTVNSMVTLNNVNSTTASYDLQPNGVNNANLSDDVNFDVWKFNSSAAVPKSGTVSSPVMKISPTSGMIGFAFADGPLYFSMPGTVSSTEYSYYFWQASYDFMTSIAFTYDSAGHTYGAAAGGDINSTSADKFSFMTDRWGISGRTSSGSYDGTNAERLESIAQYNSGATVGGTDISFDKYRIKSPSYATTRLSSGASSTNIYLAYYDNLNSEIRFRYGNLADTATSKTSFTNFAEYANITVNNTYPDTYDNITKVSVIAGGSTGRTAGEYLSLGVVPGTSLSTDVVVLIWYDSTNQTLWYSYNTTPATSRAGTSTAVGWSTPLAIFSGAGEYCQLTVDANKGIHIAAYDVNNADLVYAYLSSYSDSSPKTCTVDSYGIVGTHISIDTALDSSGNVIPYIGYYSPSSIRPKYAYKVTTSTMAPDGATSDAYTGAWEITLVPTPSTVCEDNINVGVWKTSSGVLTTSTSGTSSNTHNAGYSTASYGKCYGNGTSNGVVSYAIKSGSSGYIETAQKN